MPQQPQLERRFLQAPPSLQSREEKEAKLTVIEGYAALFNVRTVIWNWFEESISPGAFSRAIKEKHDCRSLFNHDPNWVLGRIKSGTLLLKEDDKGLWTETTPPDTQQARDVVENIRVGNVDQMSFAFIPKETKWTFSDKKGVMDHCEILDVDLYDISPVTYPAYAQTSCGLRAATEAAWREARAAWERANKPPEPVIVRGVCPAAVLAGVRARRSRYLTAA